jgi:hypothetical protein
MDRLYCAGLNQPENETEGKRLQPDARLLLVIERAVQHTVIEVKEHAASPRHSRRPHKTMSGHIQIPGGP